MSAPDPVQGVPGQGVPGQGPPAAPRSTSRDVLRALLSHKLALCGLVMLAGLVVAAVLGPALAPYGENDVDVVDRLQCP